MSNLLASLQSMDTAAWEALGSVGLVRRARKDLDGGLAVEFVGEPGETVLVRVQTFSVTFPAGGAAKATCSCPARGICQHILAAGLWLGDQRGNAAEPGAEPVSPLEGSRPRPTVPEAPAALVVDPIPVLTVAQLRKFAGATNWRLAWTLAETPGLAVVQSREPAVVSFPEMEVEIRFVPGLGLDAAICRGASASQKPRYVTAALLALWKTGEQHGELAAQAAQLQETEKAAQPEDEAGAESLPKVLAAGQSLLSDGLVIGLAHLSRAYQNRLSTLSVSALAARAPRLARILQAAADQLDDILTRQAQGDTRRLFSTLSQANALCAALAAAGPNPPADLLGVMRATYESSQEPIELYGLGAEVWRTPSGYQGLTCYFWEPLGNSLLTYSEARPESQLAGFNPVRAYLENVAWRCAAPAKLCRARVTLRRARVSSAGRISAGEGTEATLGAPVIPSAELLGERYFQDWEALAALARRLVAPGLRQPHPMSGFVALHPRGFGQQVFDPTEQVFYWPLRDAEGREILLRLPYDEWTGHGIDALEKLKPGTGADQRFVFFGRLVPEGARITLHPISILRLPSVTRDGAVFNLSLDPPHADAEPTPGSDVMNFWERWKLENQQRIAQKAQQKINSSSLVRKLRNWFAQLTPDADEPESLDDDDITDNPALLCLGRCAETLAQLAEAGTRSANALHHRALTEQAEALEQLGLTLIPPLLRALAEPGAKPAIRADHLARAGYLAHLHREIARLG